MSKTHVRTSCTLIVLVCLIWFANIWLADRNSSTSRMMRPQEHRRWNQQRKYVVTMAEPSPSELQVRPSNISVAEAISRQGAPRSVQWSARLAMRRK